jgi:hypothetical protein
VRLRAGTHCPQRFTEIAAERPAVSELSRCSGIGGASSRRVIAFEEDFDMSAFADDLPSRFPVGTRYVIEGRGGGRGALRIHLRYLEFPDGRHVELPLDVAHRTHAQRRRGGRRTRIRK